MGTYFSEEAKKALKWILILRDEKKAKNDALPKEQQLPDEQLFPTFAEFDQDPRTTRANIMPHLCNSWSSYSDAVKSAKRFLNNREALEPEKPMYSFTDSPVTKKNKASKAAKKGTHSKPIKETIKPQTAPEAPKAPETKPEPVSAPKASTEPAQTVAASPQPSPAQASTNSQPAENRKPPSQQRGFRNFKFGSQHHENQKKRESPALTQNLGSLIPSCFLEDDDEPLLEPKPEPEQTPKPEPTPEPEPAPEPESTSKPEPAPEPEPTSKPEPTPEPILALSDSGITNFYPGKISFISEDFYESYLLGEIRLGTNYATLPAGEYYAKAMELVSDCGRYETETANEGDVYVPITKSYLTPRLVKNDLVYNFPEPKEGVILLVERQVAEAARDDGRETDDLVFPKKFLRTKNGITLCAELGKL